ncbi:MAG: hypothetical protein U0470_10920 [Anaerolineae bacterium]
MMPETVKTNLTQWNEMLTAWNQFNLEASKAQMEALVSLREQWNALFTDAANRMQELAQREQAQILKAAEGWQGQVQTGVHQTTKLVETLSTAGQSLAQEAIKAAQAQAKVAQAQVSEFVTVGREMAETVADTAKATRKN